MSICIETTAAIFPCCRRWNSTLLIQPSCFSTYPAARSSKITCGRRAGCCAPEVFSNFRFRATRAWTAIRTTPGWGFRIPRSKPRPWPGAADSSRVICTARAISISGYGSLRHDDFVSSGFRTVGISEEGLRGDYPRGRVKGASGAVGEDGAAAASEGGLRSDRAGSSPGPYRAFAQTQTLSRFGPHGHLFDRRHDRPYRGPDGTQRHASANDARPDRGKRRDV